MSSRASSRSRTRCRSRWWSRARTSWLPRSAPQRARWGGSRAAGAGLPRRPEPRPEPPGTKRASTLALNSSTEPQRFVVGRVGRPHGLDGFLGLYVDEEDAAAIAPGLTVCLDDDPYVVRAIRRADRGYQVAFEGIFDRYTAEDLRGANL